jgi:hypothetical protein
VDCSSLFLCVLLSEAALALGANHSPIHIKDPLFEKTNSLPFISYSILHNFLFHIAKSLSMPAQQFKTKVDYCNFSHSLAKVYGCRYSRATRGGRGRVRRCGDVMGYVWAWYRNSGLPRLTLHPTKSIFPIDIEYSAPMCITAVCIKMLTL